MEETTVQSDVGSGQISGGWEYIGSAYGITWISLVLYIAFVFRRGEE